MSPVQSLFPPVLSLFVLVSSAAFAAECAQQDAIYEDRDKAYELRFVPVESAAAAASHIFKLAVLKTGLLLDGYVMPTDEVSRSSGIIMHNCPEGDVTGAELDACTVWEGLLYSIDDKGGAANLPDGTAAAAGEILLADLGSSIRSSALWGEGQLTVAPWDVLTLKGCGQ
ncbi:hypothetical protein MRS76_10930 [Rhizobiaceae bacterium n13]|uniref:Uncharacterized protein n=1 Tax=Ferirhizobium litorale TaxID=2927786 RepID=A0AAE3QGQ7_9HYPH|nr:hypothetical protein [Fererhizobium litorale]MDI7862473.1 hypothetical protein [Fererhizobium litorale]MDI7923640.1 hypothetical protein [Fererhizobium litorale]